MQGKGKEKYLLHNIIIQARSFLRLYMSEKKDLFISVNTVPVELEF